MGRKCLNIFGSDIIVPASDVPYANNGLSGTTNIKDAMDYVIAHLGGGSVDASLFTDLRATKIISAAGEDGWWYDLNNPSIGGTFSEGYNNVDSFMRYKIPVLAGDVLHYKRAGFGNGNIVQFAATDSNGVIKQKGNKGVGSTSAEGVTILNDGYVYVSIALNKSGQYANDDDNEPMVYVERATINNRAKERKIITTIGSSSSVDGTLNNNAAFPTILRKMLGSIDDRHSMAGANIGAIDSGALYYRRCRYDADVVLLYLCSNDSAANQRNIGTAADAYALDPADSATHETLKATYMGYLRYALYKLRTHLAKPDALIVCISVFGANGGVPADRAETIRREQRKLIQLLMADNGNKGYQYIYGLDLIPDGADYHADQTHPNEEGQRLIADGIYERLPEWVKGY